MSRKRSYDDGDDGDDGHNHGRHTSPKRPMRPRRPTAVMAYSVHPHGVRFEIGDTKVVPVKDGATLDKLVRFMMNDDSIFLYSLANIFDAYKAGRVFTLANHNGIIPAMMTMSSDMCDIRILWVHRVHRRRGVGKKLATRFPVSLVSVVLRESLPFWDHMRHEHNIKYDSVQ